MARSLVESAEAAGSEGRWYASAEEAATGLAGGISAGDLVLVKGSRGMALERVVRVLTTPLGEAG
ncbi:MAG: hypothetical protein V3R89_05735 [Thermoanaerobaculia bacterium]